MNKKIIPKFFKLGFRLRRNPEAVFDLADKHTGTTTAKNSYYAPLNLVEKENLLTFEAANTKSPIKFISLFRWFFFLIAVGMGTYAFTDLSKVGGIVKVFAIGFCSFSIFLGWLGAFVIAPRLIKFFNRADQSFTPREGILPVFDLERKELRLPDTQERIPFSQLKGFGYTKGQSKWDQLCAYCNNNKVLFLLNFPTNTQTKMEQQSKDISVCTGLTWLGELT